MIPGKFFDLEIIAYISTSLLSGISLLCQIIELVFMASKSPFITTADEEGFGNSLTPVILCWINGKAKTKVGHPLRRRIRGLRNRGSPGWASKNRGAKRPHVDLVAACQAWFYICNPVCLTIALVIQTLPRHSHQSLRGNPET